MLTATLLGASNPPAGGAATSDVIYATAGAVVVTILLMGPILLYKQGRFPLIGKLAGTAEKVTGLPGWAALPGTFLALTLLIWGTEDPVIPVSHGRNAHEVIGHSRYVEIEGSGHWPMLDAPDRIVRELTEFMEETEPFEWSLDTVRERLRRGPQPAPQQLAATTT